MPREKGVELGKAYVQIIPSAEGIKGGITEALGGEAERAGKSAGSVFSSAFGAGIKTAGKAIAAGAAIAGAAAVAVGKQALDAYADYEQLAGGAQLMFGDAYESVAERAAKAYKTVQMSQNDYLQQVNGFATGLKTALGGNEQAAADLADRILTAEADVVAATGNSQEAVQNAFNGIMKSNFSMLDNLQLGITPTKEGFQELIDKVNAWHAANGEATNYVIDNLADAQNALVDYIEMQGLSGYAAREAADTISGSVSSVKASWQNLLTALADENADFEATFDAFAESVVTAGANIIPRVIVIVGKGIPKLVVAIGKAFVAAWPEIKREGANLIDQAGEGIESALGKAKEWGGQLIQNLIEGILGKARALIDTVGGIVGSVFGASVEDRGFIGADYANGKTAGGSNGRGTAGQTVVNFTQNNYSPKALSNAEIYRRTKNQFAQLKGATT